MALLAQADGNLHDVPPEGADVGFAAGLHAGLDGRVPGHPARREPDWLDRRRVSGRRCGCRRRAAPGDAGALSRSATIRTSRTRAQCQYPVPDWDVAYAITEARECDQPAAARTRQRSSGRTQPDTIGFMTYSEGCNDDVNKSRLERAGLGSRTRRSIDILRDYSRYFIGERYADEFAQGLLALERNWRGPLADQRGRRAHTRSSSRRWSEPPSPRDRKNWRFQQAPLPRLLRRLCAQPADPRNATGGAGAWSSCARRRCAARPLAMAEAEHPRPRVDRARRAGLAQRHLPTGRGAVPEPSHMQLSVREVSGHCRGSRREPRHARLPAQ